MAEWKVRDLKNDPTELLAQRVAERVYVLLGCASVPYLQRVIADALRDPRVSDARVTEGDTND
jgi:hypothetical protein